MSMLSKSDADRNKRSNTQSVRDARRARRRLSALIAAAAFTLLASPGSQPALSQAGAEARIEIMDQIGGASYALDVVDGVIYAGVGPRMVVLDAGDGSAAPEHLGQSDPLPGVVMKLIHHRDHVYALTSGLNRTHVVALNVVDPRRPLEVGRILSEWLAFDISISDELMVLSEAPVPDVFAPTRAGLEILNIESPHALESVAWFEVDAAWGALNVEALDDRVYALDSEGVVRIFDMSDPADPRRSGIIRVPGATSIAVSSAATRLIAATEDSLLAFDLSEPDDPEEAMRFDGGRGDRLFVSGTEIWRYSSNRVERYRSADLAPLGGYWVQAGLDDLAFGNGTLFAANADAGVFVLPPITADEEVTPVATWRSVGPIGGIDVEGDRTWAMGRVGVDIVAWDERAHAIGHWPAPNNGRSIDIMAMGERAVTSRSEHGLDLIDCAAMSLEDVTGACTLKHSVKIEGAWSGMEIVGQHVDHIYAMTGLGELHPIAVEGLERLRPEKPVTFSESVTNGRGYVRMVFLDESRVLIPSSDGLARIDLSDPVAPSILEPIHLDDDSPPAGVIVQNGDDLYVLANETAARSFPALSPVEDRRLFLIEEPGVDEPFVQRLVNTLPDNWKARVAGGTLLRGLPPTLVYRDPWLLTSGRTGLIAFDPTVAEPLERAARFDLAAMVEDLAPLELDGEFIAAAGDAGVYRLRIMGSDSATEVPTAAPSPLPTRAATTVPTDAPPRPSTLYLPVVERPASPPKVATLDLDAALDGNVRDVARVDDVLYIVRGRHVEAWHVELDPGEGSDDLRFITRSPVLPAEIQGLDAVGDTIVVALGNDGIWTLRQRDEDSLEVTSRMTTADEARDVVIDGEFAFIAVNEAGLEVVSIVDPEAPTSVARVETGLPSWRLSVDDGTLVILTAISRGVSSVLRPEILIVDVSDPSTPVSRGRFSAEPSEVSGRDVHLRDVVVADDTIFAVDRSGLLLSIGVDDPARPELLSEFVLCGPSWETLTGRLAVHGGRLLVGGWGQCWFSIVDVADRRSLDLIGSIERPWDEPEGNGIVTGVVMTDSSAWLAVDDWMWEGGPAGEGEGPVDDYYAELASWRGDGGLARIDFSDPEEPLLSSEYSSPGFVIAAEAIPEGAALLVEPYEYGGTRSVTIWRLPVVGGVPGLPRHAVTLPGEEETTFGPMPIEADWPLAFVITGSGVLHSADLSSGEALGALELEGFDAYRSSLAIGAAGEGGGRVLFASGGTRTTKDLVAIDASDPRRMRILDRLPLASGNVQIAANENQLFVSMPGGALHVYVLNTSGDLEHLGMLDAVPYAYGVLSIPPYLYVQHYEKLVVYEVSDEALPHPIAEMALEGSTSVIEGEGDRIWIGGERLLSIDVSTPSAPRLDASWSPRGSDESAAFQSIVGSSTWALGINSIEGDSWSTLNVFQVP